MDNETRLTPEQADTIRQNVLACFRRFEEMETISRELGVRDPELEEMDAEARALREKLEGV